MVSFQSKQILAILKRTLNLLSYHVIDHGERVAYLVLKMLECMEEEKPITEENALFLALLHDIGAFKMGTIDNLASEDYLKFEVKDTRLHAIYGYLFLKNFHVGGAGVEAVLHHHTPFNKLADNGCSEEWRLLSGMFFVADRADMMLQTRGLTLEEAGMEAYCGRVFDPQAFALLSLAEKRFSLKERLESGAYLEDLMGIYQRMEMDFDAQINLLRTIVYAIDFRSEFTVTHTINTVSIAVEIGVLMGLSEDEINDVYFGALLHDLGKISTSLNVLEKEESLDDYEYKMMQEHVEVTEAILKGCVSDEIFKIAVRHHEKLDGSGYPHGLTGADLTVSEKIVAVSDILSALKNKRSYKKAFGKELILPILERQRTMGKLCPLVLNAVLENYDQIITGADELSQEMEAQYIAMHKTYVTMAQG